MLDLEALKDCHGWRRGAADGGAALTGPRGRSTSPTSYVGALTTATTRRLSFVAPFRDALPLGGSKPRFGHLEKNALLAFAPGGFGPAHAFISKFSTLFRR